MKNSNHREQVKQLIARKTGLEPREILDDLFFGDDLNLGELDMTEILEELEELFKIDLLAEQSEIESVKDLYDALEEKLE